MTKPALAQAYDEYYFENCCGTPYDRGGAIYQLFQRLAGKIVTDIGPKTVLDAGCAKGFLVEALRQRGVEAWGIDVSEFAIGSVHESIRPYCRVSSIAEPMPRNYDLIVCQEVLEHVPTGEADAAIDNFCQHTGDILFSSSPCDFHEPTHINLHPLEYWVEQFARRKFFHDLDFDLSIVAPWAMRFRRSEEPTCRIVSNYARKYWWCHQENAALREVGVKQRLRISELEQSTGRRSVRSFLSVSEKLRKAVQRVLAGASKP